MLVLSVLVTAIVLLIAGFSFKTTMQQRRSASRSDNYAQALALAEAGAEYGINELNTTTGAWDGWTNNGSGSYSITQPLTDKDGEKLGDFTVNITDATGNPFIQATGLIPNAVNPLIRRRVHVEAKTNTTRSPFGGVGIYSMDYVKLGSYVYTDSYDSSKTNYNASTAGTDGDIGTKTGYVDAGSNITIKGDVQAGGEIKTGSNVTITGEKIPTKSAVEPPPYPQAAHDLAKAKNDNGKIEIQVLGTNTWQRIGDGLPNLPGENKLTELTTPKRSAVWKQALTGGPAVLTLGDNMIARFPPGEYYLQGIDMQGQNVRLQDPGSVGNSVKIYLEQTADGNNAIKANKVAALNGSTNNWGSSDSASGVSNRPALLEGKPTNFQIFVKKGTLDFSGGSYITMFAGVYAPFSIFKAGTYTDIYGAMVVKSFEASANMKFHADTALLGSLPGSGAFPKFWAEVRPI